MAVVVVMKGVFMKNTVIYGGKQLPVINSTHPLVPTRAESISLKPADKEAIAIGIQQNVSILLYGETGTGKTSIARELAYLTKRPYIRTPITGYTTPDDLIGSKSVKDGATYYELGTLTGAMKLGAIHTPDEINHGQPNVLDILNAVLDDDHQITMTNGDVIRCHPDYRMIATMNPNYAGTRELNLALKGRFGITIEINALGPVAEAKLLTERTGLAPDMAGSLVTIGTMLRNNYAENKIGIYTSTRHLIAVSKLIAYGLNPKESFKKALVMQGETREERQIMSDVYDSVMKVNSPDDSDTPTVTTKSALNTLAVRIETLERERDEAVLSARKALEEARKLQEMTKNVEKEVKEAIEAKKNYLASMAEKDKQIEELQAVKNVLERAGVSFTTKEA